MSALHPKDCLHLDRPNVVGILHSSEGKNELNISALQGIDAIEFRLDLLERLPHSTELNKYPFIMTARHPEEGGNRKLSASDRLRWLTEAMPLAAFIDLELRFWEQWSSVFQFAQKVGVGVIASFHDFSCTPSLSELLKKAQQAQQLGADICKIATYLNKPSDLAILLQFLEEAPLPVAAMGMGPLGMISRLVLARCGSVLNYGFLQQPLVPGQWQAEKFAERLREL